MPITNKVEKKECYGKRNTHNESDCFKECCYIMRDECSLQTIENIDDEYYNRVYGDVF